MRADRPHLSQSSGYKSVLAFGGLWKCNSNKDRLWTHVYLVRQAWYGDDTVDQNTDQKYNDNKLIRPVERYCHNNNYNKYYTYTVATVENNGHTYRNGVNITEWQGVGCGLG